MTIGIVGLGLIGGSLAKAYKQAGEYRVLAHDSDRPTLDIAMVAGAVDAPLTEENVNACELVLIAVNPDAAIGYLEGIAPHLNRNSLMVDCCGTKRMICRTGFNLAREYGFTFVGGHPMAGTHRAGFAGSRADLFDGACMVVVPDKYDDIALLERIKRLITPAGFGQLSVTTAENHDRVIAFTSQMAHVVSNAYIKSPTAGSHKGFSAGSYRDLTRVAWLDPDMWTALFIENRDNLISELDIFIDAMSRYRAALASCDPALLRQLLDEGRMRKEEVDG